MDFRELTPSLVTFWGAGCSEHLLTGIESSSFIRQRNNWYIANIPLGLSGLFMMDWGKIVGFSIEMPIDYVPLPIFGNNIVVILCYWTQPVMSTSKHKNLLLIKVMERLERKGYDGIVVFSPGGIDNPVWEAFGFEKITECEFMGMPSYMMFRKYADVSPPSFQSPVSLLPPRQRKYTIDIFYPKYCPIGSLIISKVIKQSPNFAQIAELRVHDTSYRDVVLSSGRVIGVYLNGEDITREIIQNTPIKKIIEKIS